MYNEARTKHLINYTRSWSEIGLKNQSSKFFGNNRFVQIIFNVKKNLKQNVNIYL